MNEPTHHTIANTDEDIAVGYQLQGPDVRRIGLYSVGLVGLHVYSYVELEEVTSANRRNYI